MSVMDPEIGGADYRSGGVGDIYRGHGLVRVRCAGHGSWLFLYL